MRLILSQELFNPAYYPSLTDYSKRYQIYYGSAGSGKSYFMAQKLVLKALRDKRKVLVLRKVGRTVKQSVFQLLIDILSE